MRQDIEYLMGKQLAEKSDQVANKKRDKPLKEKSALSRELIGKIKHNKVETRKPVGRGTFRPEYIKIKDDGSAIFKSQKYESPWVHGVEEGSYFRREVAAYEVSCALGYSVPETTVREVAGNLGSAQRQVLDMETLKFSDRLKAKSLPVSQYMDLFLFDYIIFNHDRHPGNALVKDDQLVAIDHGLSFGDARKVFNMYPFAELYQMADQKVSPEMKKMLTELATSDEKMQELFETLKKYLKFGEAIACIARIESAYKKLKRNRWKASRDFIIEPKFNPSKKSISSDPENEVYHKYSTTDEQLLKVG